ncbi:hypothetical protein RIF29_06255 [Crotalaria pallida]|uniref:Uncharacterized protein n=1 Tax=Crotalaria pallida TaxID=3830 RepID=A0AAN9PA83_CROPI
MVIKYDNYKFISHFKQRPNFFHVLAGLGAGHGLLLEIIMTLGLMYTVYATASDPKRVTYGALAPLAIGLTVDANILVGRRFGGACMNHWIYWVGPLIGAALAALTNLWLLKIFC